MDAPQEDACVEKIAALQKDIGMKKTFIASCSALVEACEASDTLAPRVQDAIAEATKRAFTVLQTRFSSPKFWQAGLDLFLAVEFHIEPGKIPDVEKWRDAALEEVDDDCRERARQQKEVRKLREDQKFRRGPFSELTMAEILGSQGIITMDADDARPGMSRDARDELRVKKLVTADHCVVCQEALPVGTVAKLMPCGHAFHPDCLDKWVLKSNSCPTCRNDEMPSEKQHFDLDERRVVQSGGRGLYS
jgi:hypothetical protein